MGPTLINYEFMIPNFEDAGCIVFLPYRNDWHIENLLGASVRRATQDYTEVRYVRVTVCARNQ